MGVTHKRRQTWNDGFRKHSQGAEDKKKKVPYDAEALRHLPFSWEKHASKLAPINETRSLLEDCKDIVKVIEHASGDGSENEETNKARIAKSTKALIDFSTRQQGLIQALQLQNKTLQQSNETHVETMQIQSEINSIAQCSLQVAYSKLHAILGDIQQGGESCERASTAEKMHSAMERVLSCTKLVMQKNKDDAKDLHHAYNESNSKTQIGANASANHPVLIDNYYSAEMQQLLSPRGNHVFGRKRKATSLKAKIKHFFSSCFRPLGASLERFERTEEEKILACLEECRELLATRSTAGGKSKSARRKPAADAAKSNGMLDDKTLAREVCLLSQLPNNTLNTINSLLHKSERYTIDVVSKLLCECRHLQGELEKKHGVERELLRSLDEMNLKILTSENKACQVAMEMLMMSGDQPSLNPWS
jgi:hypothetical protein